MGRQPVETDRRSVGQQLVEQHADRIHIGGRAGGLAGNLLGCGTRHREVAHAVYRRLRGCGIQLLADAEIEQARLAGAVHHDVGGLDVAVQDQALVRVLHRAKHGEHQANPRRQLQPVFAAVVDDRLPLDVLHGQVGAPVGQFASVYQPRDGWVLQRGEDRAFAAEAFGCLRGLVRPRHLERDLLGAPVDAALGEVHLAHAAGAKRAQHAERPRLGAGVEIAAVRECAQGLVDGGVSSAVVTARGHRTLMPGDQSADCMRERGVAAAAGGQFALPRIRREIDQLVEQLRGELPLVGFAAHQPDVPNWSCIQARAKAHSRFAVASEMPQTSAVSSIERPVK